MRCITRLDEVCKDIRNAARVVGNPSLYRYIHRTVASVIYVYTYPPMFASLVKNIFTVLLFCYFVCLIKSFHFTFTYLNFPLFPFLILFSVGIWRQFHCV